MTKPTGRPRGRPRKHPRPEDSATAPAPATATEQREAGAHLDEEIANMDREIERLEVVGRED
jgi:hypothetical protein